MHNEINVLGASNNVMQSRGKLKHYLDYWPNFHDCRGTAIELQDTVTATHAATSGTSLMNL
jgi:hypothetical protein